MPLRTSDAFYQQCDYFVLIVPTLVDWEISQGKVLVHSSLQTPGSGNVLQRWLNKEFSLNTIHIKGNPMIQN